MVYGTESECTTSCQYMKNNVHRYHRNKGEVENILLLYLSIYVDAIFAVIAILTMCIFMDLFTRQMAGKGQCDETTSSL